MQDALCDSSEIVRDSASQAFNTLYSIVGADAIDKVLPALLRMLSSNSGSRADVAVQGVRQVLSVRAKDVFPRLLPALLRPPIPSVNARAFAAVVDVTGPVLHHYLPAIIPVLISSLANDAPETIPRVNEAGTGVISQGAETKVGDTGESKITDTLDPDLCAAAKTSVLSISEAGTQWLLVELTTYLKQSSLSRKRAALWVLAEYMAGTSNDFTTQVPMLIKEVFNCMGDSSELRPPFFNSRCSYISLQISKF